MNVSRQKMTIQPGELWRDTDGKIIEAHGGGMLYIEGTYYWYGENKDAKTQVIPFVASWTNEEKAYRHRTDVIGVSCYSSKDLINWKNEGVVLPAVQDDSTHDLYFQNVLERPKVIYNEKTNQYVMWMHIDTADYQYARAGVAVSHCPTGPFRYIKSIRPNDAMSRDMTLFKDDDGQAYLFFSSEKNSTMYVSKLADDYLKPTGEFTRNFVQKYREAPAVCKYNNKYFIITSACTGWDPNEAEYAVANSPLGPWEIGGNPCIGKGTDTTFDSQSTHIIPVEGKGGCFIFMADRWKKEDLHDSRYIWLPMCIEDDRITIKWNEQWDMNIFDKKTS